MTDSSASTPEQLNDSAQPTSGADDPQHDPAEAMRKARSDAAAYRRRLRDAEAERDSVTAERDQLRVRVEHRQRADVEALAGQRLTDGTDVWQAVDLAAVLDDDGEIDKAKVSAAIDGLVRAKPHYGTRRPDFELGHRGSAEPRAAGWGDVLRGRRQSRPD